MKNAEKIIINAGVGRLSQQGQFKEKILPEIMKELALISGQKPALSPAKKSIAGFKTRTGDIIGLKITLRGRRMDDFLKRLINIVLPRVKDFRGLNLKNVDKSGNLNIGLREQSVFPEINVEASKVNFGLQITVVSLIKDREKAIDFWRSVGIPLKKS